MAIQRHVVVIPRDDGGIEIHPMKEWLRQHPDQMPPHLDPDPTASTSHQLRSGLRKMGWTMEETPTEVRVLAPGTKVKIGEGVLEPPPETDGEDESFFFSLEYQLRDFLADNLAVVEINGRKLRLFIDATGRDGIEYPSPVGPIDILAVDNDGAFFVFELKRANSPDALGQVTRYMGWVKQTIGKGKDVYGIIVAKTISEKLKFARTVVPNVYLFEYQVSFALTQAHDLSVGHADHASM
jgi:endonuclease